MGDSLLFSSWEGRDLPSLVLRTGEENLPFSSWLMEEKNLPSSLPPGE
jgi:hypothetical protein